MSVALCIRCGDWKQSPSHKCRCGFLPAKGSLDEARSFLLTEPFRSEGELEQLAGTIRAGEPLPAFDESELRMAKGIVFWTAALNLAWLTVAVLLGILVGALFARLSGLTLMILGAVLLIALLITRALRTHLDRRVERVRTQRA